MTKNKEISSKNIIRYIWKQTYLLPVLVLAIPLFALGILCNSAWLMYPCGLLMITVYDSFGYNYTLRRDNPNTFRPKEILLHGVANASYRIDQFLFMGMVAGFVVYVDWLVAILLFVSWLFGVMDYFYYLLIRQYDYLINLEEMPWLWWTPQGWLFAAVTGTLLEGISLFITVMSLVIIYFRDYLL